MTEEIEKELANMNLDKYDEEDGRIIHLMCNLMIRGSRVHH